MTKIFISHSSKDVDVVEELIEMIEAIGVTPDKIFCSSFEGYGVELGDDFLRKIKEELSSNTIVIFVLSNNFYKSPVCLCEMGAAWVMSKEHVPILVPPLEFSDVEGVIPTSIGMKINDPLKYNSLKKKIESFFEIESAIDSSAWERKRDRILKRIQNTLHKKTEIEQGLLELNENNGEKEKMVFDEPFFYLVNGEDKDGPYCPRCWQKDDKKVRVVKTPDSYNGAQKCQVCNENFGKGKPIPAPKIIRRP